MIKENDFQEWNKINENFGSLLDNFKNVSELYKNLDYYENHKCQSIYSLDIETINQICCQHLSSNIIHYFKTQENKIKG